MNAIFLAACMCAPSCECVGQCGPNGCAVAVSEPMQWRRIDGDANRWYLFRGQVQIGGFDPAKSIYRSYDAASDTWGEAQSKPPIATPDGVDCSKLTGRSRIEMNGVAAAWGDIPDDSGKPRVTIIGGATDRKKVETDLKQNGLADKVSIWSVEPSHWSLRDSDGGPPRFKTDGAPTVYVQDASGKVLHRQDDWTGDGVGAIRKAVKGYDAGADPDLRKTTVPVPGGASPAALLGLLAFLFSFAKYKGVL